MEIRCLIVILWGGRLWALLQCCQHCKLRQRSFPGLNFHIRMHHHHHPCHLQRLNVAARPTWWLHRSRAGGLQQLQPQPGLPCHHHLHHDDYSWVTLLIWMWPCTTRDRTALNWTGLRLGLEHLDLHHHHHRHSHPPNFDQHPHNHHQIILS